LVKKNILAALRGSLKARDFRLSTNSREREIKCESEYLRKRRSGTGRNWKGDKPSEEGERSRVIVSGWAAKEKKLTTLIPAS